MKFAFLISCQVLSHICQAYSDVKTVISTLQDVRKSICSKHRTWHEIALTLGRKVNASEPTMPTNLYTL